MAETKCYACDDPAERSCPRCGRFFCLDHGEIQTYRGPCCAECAAGGRGVLLLVLGVFATLVALWLLGHFGH